MIPAQIELDSIIQYVSVELKLHSKKEAHIGDSHNHRNHDCPENQSHREIQEEPVQVRKMGEEYQGVRL